LRRRRKFGRGTVVKSVFDYRFKLNKPEPCERLLVHPQKIQMGLYQQAFRQMRAFSSQLQISVLSSAFSKPNQAKLTMFTLGANNFNELPMQNT